MRNVEKISWAEFIAQYDPSVQDAVAEARRRPGTVGIATLKCEALDSSRCGQLTALIYGPQCTYKSIDEMSSRPMGIYVNGLPSSAAFPYNYTEDMPS
jgi:hypothetical protein